MSHILTTSWSNNNSDLLTDIDSVDEAMKESWWKRLVEGDAQALNKHYAKLSSVLGTFIVSIP